jgi:hypothetical protein
VKKLNRIQQYNKYMSHVNQQDKMLSYNRDKHISNDDAERIQPALQILWKKNG